MADSKYVRLYLGRYIADKTFDEANIPTSDQKAALAGEGTPSGSNKYTTKSYVDAAIAGLDWQESVLQGVNYIKATSGAPSGTATNGEYCLNTNEAKLYAYTSSWDGGTSVSSGNRYIFKDSGSDTSGDSGTHTADNKIYAYNGATFGTFTPTKGSAVYIEDVAYAYIYNGTAWVVFGSLTNARMRVITFAYRGGFAANQTDVEPYEVSGVEQRVLMPTSFSIVKVAHTATAAVEAGTLDIEPTINGTKLTPSGLDVQLAYTETEEYKEVSAGTSGYTGVAGAHVGLKMTSSADWAPVTCDLIMEVYVVFTS